MILPKTLVNVDSFSEWTCKQQGTNSKLYKNWCIIGKSKYLCLQSGKYVYSGKIHNNILVKLAVY